MVDDATAAHGGLSGLVNNASSFYPTPVDATSETHWNDLMGTNLKAPFFLSQAARPALAASGGSIVNMADIYGVRPLTGHPVYCMAKAALGMMTKLYGVRLAAHGIRVYEICPGIIASDMTAPVKAKYDKLIAEGLTPMPRWGEPSDIGKAIIAIAQDLLPFSTGEVINVDGGFHLRSL